VLSNVWAIARESNYWTEPEKFYPERFIDSSTIKEVILSIFLLALEEEYAQGAHLV
jgi:cytochrome P450